MENFPAKIVRQPLPRTFCGEKMPGRPCRGLFGAKNGSAEAAADFLWPKNARQRLPRAFLRQKNGAAEAAEDFLWRKNARQRLPRAFWGKKIARQTLPRTSCGKKTRGRLCRGLFGAKKWRGSLCRGFPAIKKCAAGSAEAKKRSPKPFSGQWTRLSIFGELFLSCSRGEADVQSRRCATFRSRAERRVPSPDPHGSRA